MEKSTSIAEIAKALSVFQDEVPHLTLDRTVKVKTKTGSDYSFKYATFAQILEVVRPLLSKNKMAFSQLVEPDGSVTTILMHESGEYLSSNLLIKGEQTPQGIGSSITYTKRYAIVSILGLVAEDDDDANIAEGNKHEVSEDKRQWLNPNTPQWAEAIKYLQGVGTIDKIRTKYRISKANEEKLKQETLVTA